MEGGTIPAEIQKYLGNLEIPKLRYVNTEKKLKTILTKGLDLSWFPGNKPGVELYLQQRKDQSKKIRVDTNKLLIDQLNITFEEYELLLDKILNYNSFTAVYLIGDNQKKRDLDLLVVVTEDVKIPLSDTENKRLLSEISKLDADKVTQGKLDINYINMDSENNITEASKGQAKFTQNILHFTYGINKQIYKLEPLSKSFLPSDNNILLDLELINMVDSIIKRILDGLKKLDPEDYKRLSKIKGDIYNSDSETRIKFVIDFINKWLDRKRGINLSTDQQEILKSLSIKIIQFILWRERVVNTNYFSKQGALDLFIGLGISLNREHILRILYIKEDDNQTSEYFRDLWNIFQSEGPKYLWELPGISTKWKSIKIQRLDGDPFYDAVRTNPRFIYIIGDLYQAKFQKVPELGQPINIQENFVDKLNPDHILSLKTILNKLQIVDFNPRSVEWLQMISDPSYKFGNNTGIKTYQKYPDWRIQLKDFYHLIQGLIAETDVLQHFPFKTIFPDFELMEVGALIERGDISPFLGICPDGLLVKTSKPEEIIPIEIKKIELGSSKVVQREIDLATRQLSGTQDMINRYYPGMVKNVCIILYNFNKFEIFYKIF